MLILIIISLITSGCWDYIEIDDMAIAAGAAVDYDNIKEKLIITLELVSPRVEDPTMEGGITSIDIQQEGENFFDSERNLITKLGKKVFWSHSKVLIFSKETIENESLFVSVLDHFMRDDEIRDDIWVLVSGEKTAGEIILDSDYEIQQSTSYYLDDILKNQGSISKYSGVQFWQFTDQLASKGIEPTLPILTMTRKRSDMLEKDMPDMEENRLTPTIKGNCVFKGTKIVGFLDQTESKSLLIMKDELKGGVIVIEIKNGLQNENIKISLEIFSSKTKITPKIEGNNIIMDIDVKISVNLGESQSQQDIMQKESKEKLENIAQDQIKEELKQLIKKVQTEYESDIFGFGNLVERKDKKLWKEIKNDWNREFSDVTCNINVDLNIRSSGLRSGPIEINE